MPAPDPLFHARSLRGLIESEADVIEQHTHISQPVVDAIDRAGLFRLITPKDLGGQEAGSATIIDVCEELSYADGSVGWAYAQNITVGAYAAYLAPEHARALASARTGAGHFAPLGVAREEDGGYRVSGSYKFGSGCSHAEFMGGSALLMRGDELAPMVDGRIPAIAFILPAERVMIKGNWDVIGLRGTGSFDFEVPEQFVEAGACFDLFRAETRTGGPIYGLGSIAIGTIGSCAWAIGVARRALDEIAEIARGGRVRLGQAPLREQPTFQRDFGFHLSALKSARLLAIETYEGAVDAIGSGASEDVVAARIRETRADANHVVHVAKLATTFAWEASGSAGMRNPSRLQRCFRDISTGSGHMVFDERNYGEVAKSALGLDPLPY